MKLTFLILVCLMANCSAPAKKQVAETNSKSVSTHKSDSLISDNQVNSFEAKYKRLVEELYDSVSKFKTDNIDFSCITGGLEKNFSACNDEPTKVLLGYKLAANYMIHFNNSKEKVFRQKAESLFFSFINFTNGKLAAQYLGLDIKKVRYMQMKWENFPEQEKETLLMYGLLRGFKNGIPDILKNIE